MKKHNFLSKISLVFLFSIMGNLTINQTSLAEGTNFFCALNDQDNPTTFAKTNLGTIPIINWTSELGGGYTPEKRCQIVSEKFQNFYERGILKFLTTGYIRTESGNNINFICPTNSNNGSCICLKKNDSRCEEYEILYTLKPGDDPTTKLKQLMEIRTNSNSGPIRETNGRIYIDMNIYLLNAIPITYIPKPLKKIDFFDNSNQ